MQNPKTIIEFLGVEKIAERVDVSKARVIRARFGSHLPASWYFALSDMAGTSLPRELFSFKGAPRQGGGQ